MKGVLGRYKAREAPAWTGRWQQRGRARKAALAQNVAQNPLRNVKSRHMPEVKTAGDEIHLACKENCKSSIFGPTETC